MRSLCITTLLIMFSLFLFMAIMVGCSPDGEHVRDDTKFGEYRSVEIDGKECIIHVIPFNRVRGITCNWETQ